MTERNIHENILEGAKRTKNVIKEAHICGLVSKNGYTYPADVLKSAVPLYENVDIYVNHNDNRPRPIEEKIGMVKNAFFKEGKGIIGDLVLNEAHPAYEQLTWFADNMPSKVGCSHDVAGSINRKEKLVESIKAVHSVDLVSQPATTQGLIEGVISDKINGVGLKNRLDKVIRATTDLLYEVLWPSTNPTTDEDRLKATQVVLKDALAEIKTLSTTKESVMEWDKLTLDDVRKNAPHIAKVIDEKLTEACKVAVEKEKQVQVVLAKLPEKARTAIFESQIRGAATIADAEKIVEAIVSITAPAKVQSTSTSGTVTEPLKEGQKGFSVEDVDAALGIKESK